MITGWAMSFIGDVKIAIGVALHMKPPLDALVHHIDLEQSQFPDIHADELEFGSFCFNFKISHPVQIYESIRFGKQSIQRRVK